MVATTIEWLAPPAAKRSVAPFLKYPAICQYTKSVSLKYEPASEPLHISVK